ncbi:MAG: hypothetical protein V9G04_18050 [Nocardioides sp.]
MSPAAIGPVKAMLTELPLGELEVFMAENLAGNAAMAPMRALLQGFADHGEYRFSHGFWGFHT